MKQQRLNFKFSGLLRKAGDILFLVSEDEEWSPVDSFQGNLLRICTKTNTLW